MKFELSTAYGKAALQMMGMAVGGSLQAGPGKKFVAPGPATLELLRMEQKPSGEPGTFHMDWIFAVEFGPDVDAEALSMWLYSNLKVCPKGWVDVNGKVFDPTLSNLQRLISSTLGM